MTRVLLAATLLVFAGSAYAADMPLKAPPAAPPAPTWTGWYIGVNGGGGWGRVSPNASDVGPDLFFAGANVPAVVAGASRGFHETGGLAGGQVGYLYQPAPGQAIVGLDVAFDWSGLKGIRQQRLHPLPRHGAHRLSAGIWPPKSQSLFTAVGRIGPDMGMWFPYVSAGAAYLPSDLQRELHRYLLSIRFKQLVQQGRGRLGCWRRRRVPLCRALAIARRIPPYGVRQHQRFRPNRVHPRRR